MTASADSSLLMNTTTAASLITNVTYPWDEPTGKEARRTVYYTLHGIVGFCTIVCNGTLLLLYYKRHKVRKHISFIMLNVFISCFIHGWLVGIMYPLQRVYRYVMLDWICVITTLVMDLADRHILLLLPVLAIERLILVKFPFMRKKRTKFMATCASVGVLIFAMLYTWLPLIPQLDVPTTPYLHSTNPARQQQIDTFYKMYTCHGKLNKKNNLEPVFTLLVSCLCVIVVIGIYAKMFFIAKARFARFPAISQKKKRKLKKAAITVMLVSLIFIFTLLPYGILLPTISICGADVSRRRNSFCNGITLELRFIFSFVAHLGNLIAPLLFALLSPNIRDAVKDFVASGLPCKGICRKIRGVETTEQDSLSPRSTSTHKKQVIEEPALLSYHNIHSCDKSNNTETV